MTLSLVYPSQCHDGFGRNRSILSPLDEHTSETGIAGGEAINSGGDRDVARAGR